MPEKFQVSANPERQKKRIKLNYLLFWLKTNSYKQRVINTVYKQLADIQNLYSLCTNEHLFNQNICSYTHFA